MSYSKIFREHVRHFEFLLDSVDEEECCCCSVNRQQCFADRIRTDKSAVSRTVDDLVKKGYVIRKPSEIDRRYVELSLTEMGSVQFEKIEKTMDDKFLHIFSNIPQDKKKQVLESLELINLALETIKQ